MSWEVLVDRIERELGLAEMIVAARESYDPVGHADRMVT